MDHNFKNILEHELSDVLGENIQILNSGGIGGGCINHASKIQTNAGSFFLKWNDSCASDMFLREAEGLRELANASDGTLLIPEVICLSEVDDRQGFLVLEYLSPAYSGSSDEEKLGIGLAHIHKYHNKQFGFSSNNYCGATPQNNAWHDTWLEFYRENRLNYLIRLIDKKYRLSTDTRKIFDRLLNRLDKLLPQKAQASVIHGDLWSGNFMITDKGPALIDPAACYAEREMEFGIITMFGGFSSRFFEAYNSVSPLENDWKERNNIYQLYHILNHYYLFGGFYLQQAVTTAKSYL